MALFWIGAIIILIGVVIALGSLAIEQKLMGFISAGVIVLIGLGLWGLGSFYSQDAGEAIVLKSISGEVRDQPSIGDEFHSKAAWESTNSWDIRDNTLSFAGSKEDVHTDYNGGTVTGPRITVQDKNDVDAYVDLTFRYSITGDNVVNLYKRFGPQEDLSLNVIEPEIRSAVRDAAGKYLTTDIVSKRPEIAADVRKILEKKWEPLGIVIEGVDIQEITQPQAIKDANAENAAASVLVDKEEKLKQQAVIAAEKNAIKTKELSPEILMEQYIDAIKTRGFVVITENGSVPMLNLPQPK